MLEPRLSCSAEVMQSAESNTDGVESCGGLRRGHPVDARSLKIYARLQGPGVQQRGPTTLGFRVWGLGLGFRV